MIKITNTSSAPQVERRKHERAEAPQAAPTPLLPPAKPETALTVATGQDGFINVKEAAELMQIKPATLRNYIWLLGMSKQERAQRFLQDPPTKMPKPKRMRGHPVWPAEKFHAWLPIWQSRKN